jgi:hypothetical protein
MAAFTQDAYNVVENSPHTYRAAAAELRGFGSILLGWTDNNFSHMDVLLVYEPREVGPLNRMDSRASKLIVAVAGRGMFGFAVRGDDPIHHAYLAEKLGFSPSVTTEALAELVNGVMAALVETVVS